MTPKRKYLSSITTLACSKTEMSDVQYYFILTPWHDPELRNEFTLSTFNTL